MMQTPEFLTGLVNLVATGSSLLLLHRGPSPRLRRLILAAGIMTMAQLSVMVYSSMRGLSFLGSVHQALVGVAAIYALRLLYEETHERRLVDAPVNTSDELHAPQPVQPVDPIEPSHWLQPAAKQRHSATMENGDPVVIEKIQKPALEPCTTDLLALANAIGTSPLLALEPEPVTVTRQSPWPLC